MKIVFKAILCVMLLMLMFGIDVLAQQERLVLPLEQGGVLSRKVVSDKVFEIIDITGDSIIGYTQGVEKNNDRVGIYPPVPKNEWISSMLNLKNIDQSLKSGYSYLFILKDLSVGGNGQMSYVKVKGELYEALIGSNAYIHVKGVDGFYVNQSAGLQSSGNNISNLIIDKLSTQGGGVVNISDIKPKTQEEIIKQEIEKLSFIRNKTFPTGIYMSFEELKLLKPSYDQFFIKVDTISNSVLVNGFTVSDSTLHPTLGAYAIAVGNELYVYKNKKLYPVEAIGNLLYLSKYVDPAIRKNNARFWSYNVGSIIQREYGNPFDNVYAMKLSEYKGEKISEEAIKVNCDNGDFEL